MTFSYLHRYAALVHFFHLSRAVTPWLGAATLLLFGLGLLGGLVLAPADYQQGDSFRIIYVHVPAAWMSLFVYVVMAASGAIGLVWKVKLGEIICRCAAPLGAGYTALALASGALWGKPMWGTWWVWDARLTSELILLLLYLGVLALHGAFEERRV
ncbi:MAG: heme ABC transporter permease, partial [Alphaproteobacteria bacterium]|nr:heme ABC transporter permease [Alphaproteobacteria bacterium]